MSEKKSRHVCAVPKCLNKGYNSNKKFYRFPKDPYRAAIWAVNAHREDLLERLPDLYRSYRLCEVHFEEEMFTSHLHTRLVAIACPTLFPSLAGSSRTLVMDEHSYCARWPFVPTVAEADLDSSAVSVELLTENEPSNPEEHLDDPSCGKRKGLIAYRIYKVPKLNTESNATIAAPSEPSTSTSTSPLNESENVYVKEEPSEEVQEEFESEVKIDTDDTFEEPQLHSGTDTLKLEYIEQILESKSDLVTLFHNLSQLAKRLDPLDQALFQNQVSNTVLQMKILQLRKTSC